MIRPNEKEEELGAKKKKKYYYQQPRKMMMDGTPPVYVDTLGPRAESKNIDNGCRMGGTTVERILNDIFCPFCEKI